MGTDQHRPNAEREPLENAAGRPSGSDDMARRTGGATMHPLFQIARLLGRQAAQEVIASNRTPMTPETLP
jgi:hypothetical protein